MDVDKIIVGALIAGAIPVAQQIVGLGEVLCGIIGTVVNVAKLVFRSIQKQVFERQLTNLNTLPENDSFSSETSPEFIHKFPFQDEIESLEERLRLLNADKEDRRSINNAKENVKWCGILIGIGLLTTIPIAGTITNIVLYKTN